jgi:phenylalanyl-tRNA synthetase beta chain
MRYSYNWLKELSGTKLSVAEMADLLTVHSFEIENIENVGRKLENVIVGKILEISKHPGADRLQVTKIDTGKEKLQIVCGAQNIKVGDKVPVALVGAELPNGIEIKEAEIRGVKSFGMLCAKDELGIGADHSGIFVLDKSKKTGSLFSKALGLDDWIIEIDVLANRAHDALSHVGIAREIAALSGVKMKYAYDEIKLPNKKTKKISIKIADNKIASRYIGAVIENIKIQESPGWLQSRLERCGVRPINNIVDVTNYVMLELGQPLHAFDFDKIKNGISNSEFRISNEIQDIKYETRKAEIVVRKAKSGESIKLLDGSMKKLISEDIVIANKEKALALAGIMGGLESAIDENTQTIILEAATFDAASIRKTRMRLGIMTDAALRFEKNLDSNLTEKAITRAIEIIEHISDGELEGSANVYPKKKKPWNIILDQEYVNKLLGEKISINVSKKILTSLDFKIGKTSGYRFMVTVPTFRLDVTTQEDLIEEIGRIYGYEKIRSATSLTKMQPTTRNEKRLFERQVKNILVAQGFSEIYNYSFYSQKNAEMSGLELIKHLELQNPSNPDQVLMRASLIPNILKNIRENLKNFKEFYIFEIGKTYQSQEDSFSGEKNMLVGAIVLEKKNANKEKQDKRLESSFFEIKSIVNNFLQQIGITDQYYDNFRFEFLESMHFFWHKNRSAEIKINSNGQSVGFLGEINPIMLSRFDIHTRVAMFEFDMKKLYSISEQEREYVPIGKYPVVLRDISLIVRPDVRVDDILIVIQKTGGDLVLDVDLFDAIDFIDDTSSFAFHIMLGNNERTLTGKEIDEVMNHIIQELENNLHLKVRR